MRGGQGVQGWSGLRSRGRRRRRAGGQVPVVGVLGAVLAAVAALGGCSSGAPGSSEAGFDLPALSPSEAAEAAALAGTVPVPVAGVLRVQPDGCFTWQEPGGEADGAWLVWPRGVHQDGDAVVLRNAGDQLADGSPLSGTGVLVSPADLPGGDNPDSYFASFAAFCGAAERGVLILTEVVPGP